MTLRLFTPVCTITGERLAMQLDEADSAKIGRGGPWSATITDRETGQRWNVRGAPCGASARCFCDADATPVPPVAETAPDPVGLSPFELLRHHITGAIERGESEAIAAVEQVQPDPVADLRERFAQLAVEFPNYPLADLPPIPPQWIDLSWHNDACPSFEITPSLCVFVDYADPKLSDFFEPRTEFQLPRFSLHRMEESQMPVWTTDPLGRMTPLASDEWNEILAGAIAETFADNLRETLSAEEFETMRAKNATPTYAEGCCASHDVCDANMPMGDAFETVMGRDVFTGDELLQPEADLWNRAWEIARERHLIEAPAPTDSNVFERFAALFPASVGMIEPGLKGALESMPLDSGCGDDCAKALAAAASFRDALAMAWGADGYPGRVTPAQIGVTAAEACGTFITG